MGQEDKSYLKIATHTSQHVLHNVVTLSLYREYICGVYVHGLATETIDVVQLSMAIVQLRSMIIAT